MYRLPTLLLCLTGCATTHLTAAETKDCESFSEVDAAVRAELDHLLASSPGDVLVREASRLNLARRACARHRISMLREVREAEGVEAVQQELDALTRTYGADELRLLIVDALGPESAQVMPLLAEAKQRTARERSTKGNEKRDDTALEKLAVDGPSRVGPEPVAPDTMCDAPTPCEQLQCIANEGADVTGPARACFDSLDKNDAPKEARSLAKILALLPPGISGIRTEVTLRLEALRVTEWQRLDREVKAGHAALAAEIASPFAGLEAYRETVATLRDQAQARHVARAKTLSANAEASWLHARIAETFGGPVLDEPTRSGKWDSIRWRCPTEQPALPAPPAGISGTLQVRCEQARQPSGTSTSNDAKDDIMRTFDLEKTMAAQRVMISLNVQCADRSSLFTVNADDVDAVPRELSRSFEQVVAACVNIHHLAATRSCTELRKKAAGEITARFVEHARFNQQWEPCFIEWLAAEEGASPPPVPPFPLSR